MGSGVPLLNDYKKEFFLKRLPQTILGGPKLKLGYRAPAYVYISQLVLFVLPWIIGGVFTALAQYELISPEISVFASGGTMILCVLIGQIISAMNKRKKSSIAPSDLSKGKNVLAEEDEIDFYSCCDMETIGFVIPPKKFIVNIIFHTLLSGPLVGISVWYFLPRTLDDLYGDNPAATYILYVLGWLTVCIAQYSLTVMAPPELSIYQTTDSYEITPLTRPFYVLVCLAIHLADMYSSGFTAANQALHIVFVCLPLLWAVGFLSPIDALIFWAMEQVLIFLFGGSPMASNLRLFLMSIASVGLFLLVYYIPAGPQTVIVMAVCGYILSTDLGGMGSKILRSCCHRDEPIRTEHGNTGFLWNWRVKEVIFHVCMTLVAGGITAVVTFLKPEASEASDLASYIGYGVIGILVLEVVLSEVQSVYVFLGLWRNILFPSSVQVTASFTKHAKRLRVAGHIRRALINFVGPLLMLVYLSLEFDFTSEGSTLSANSTVPPVLNVLAVIRAYRWVWQSSQNSLLELSVASVIDLVVSGSTWFGSMGLGVQLLILSVIRDRLSRVWNKLYFWFTLTVKSWSNKTLRRKSTPCLIAMNFVLFPLVLVAMVISAALAAPLLPLFTLPVFLIGYPRPQRFWPGPVGISQSTCGDTVYYQQAAPQLAKAFNDAFARGSIGNASPGKHYLVRFQDRLVWVQVLEQGYCFCTISIKGMELQETSCHTVEATRIDDIIESTFEIGERAGSCCSCNQYPLHTLRPYDAAIVKTYSDAKNQLTGVIDNPDTLKMVKSGFPKTLLWVFIDYMMKHPNNDVNKAKDVTDDKYDRPPSVSSQTKFRKSEISSTSVEFETGLGNSRPKSRGGVSDKSFANSDWSDDNDSLLNSSPGKDKNKINLMEDFAAHKSGKTQGGDLPPVEMKPLTSPFKPSKGLGKKQHDIDNLFEELDFGLPATDVSVSKSNNLVSNSLFRTSNPTENRTPLQSINFISKHSERIAFPSKWCELPVDKGRLNLHGSQFDSDWFKYVITLLEFESANGKSGDQVAKEMSEDTILMDLYRDVVMTCYTIVYDLGLSGSDAVSLGPSLVHKVYSGEVPWSPSSDWLTENKQLLAITLQAYRYAVKLAIDQALLGEVSDQAELREYMVEYDNDWFIGTEKDPGWDDAIVKAKPQLFSLYHDTSKGVYNSRVLTVQDTPLYISSLNPEGVHAQWANLVPEILYMTNDDEERYSIQAHPTLLRNLNVQAADPPLGYPIYASEAISVPTL